MKEKTYTVAVKGCRYNKFKITAKGVRKAKDAAIAQFKAEYGEYWDAIETRAVADWKERKE